MDTVVTKRYIIGAAETDTCTRMRWKFHRCAACMLQGISSQFQFQLADNHDVSLNATLGLSIFPDGAYSILVSLANYIT